MTEETNTQNLSTEKDKDEAVVVRPAPTEAAAPDPAVVEAVQAEVAGNMSGYAAGELRATTTRDGHAVLEAAGLTSPDPNKVDDSALYGSNGSPVTPADYAAAKAAYGSEANTAGAAAYAASKSGPEAPAASTSGPAV